jgi:hypothetical protein
MEHTEVNDVLMGSVLQANLGQAPARQAAKYGGLPDHVNCTTINKVCASGMKSIAIGAQNILLGDAHVVVAGGMVAFVLWNHAQESLWMLPGLWSIFFSLGIFASYRLLPKATKTQALRSRFAAFLDARLAAGALAA